MAAIEQGQGQVDDPEWIEILSGPQDVLPTLGSYPIAALRLEHEPVAKLHRLGVRSLDALLRLPRTSLQSRFGAQLLTRIDQCSGERIESIRAYRAGIPMEVNHTWEHPIGELSALGNAIRSVAGELCQRLRGKDHGALRLVCRFSLERQSLPVDQPYASNVSLAHILQLGLFRPSHDAQHIAWLLLGQLELNPPRLTGDIAVRDLTLEANVTAPLKWVQAPLFDQPEAKHRDDIARLIDSLSARLGRNQVLAPRSVRDPLPENQQQLRPLTGLRPDGSMQQTHRKLPRAPKRDYARERSLEVPLETFLARPCHLAAAPVAIQVITSETGVPIEVAWASGRAAIENLAGPERIESGWWSGPSQRRDYYRIALDTGDWWWIFHDLRQGGWFLHGAFA
jgi:protein ImuB